MSEYILRNGLVRDSDYAIIKCPRFIWLKEGKKIVSWKERESFYKKLPEYEDAK